MTPADQGATWSTTPDQYARPMLVMKTDPRVLAQRYPQRSNTPAPMENEYPEQGPIFKRWS